MRFNRRNARLLSTAYLVATCWAAMPVLADPTDWSTPVVPPGLFGNLAGGQVCGFESGGCGPTAATNSFTYLQNRYSWVYGSKLIPVDPTSTAIDLATNYMNTQPEPTGTYIDDFITGKMNYIDSKVGNTLYHAQVDPKVLNSGVTSAKFTKVMVPTWEFLRKEINDGEDVEILGNRFDDTGKQIAGGYLTAVRMEWVDLNMDGKIGVDEDAFLSLISPTDGLLKRLPLYQNFTGQLVIQNPADLLDIQITAVVSESPVPEPSVAWLVGVGFTLLIFVRSRRGWSRGRATKASHPVSVR